MILMMKILKIKKILLLKEAKKAEILLDNYSKKQNIFTLFFKGILRTYYLGENGKFIPKIFFSENYFSASKVFITKRFI